MDGTTAAPVLVEEGALVIVAAPLGLVVDDTVAVLPPIEADPLLSPLVLPVVFDDLIVDVTRVLKLADSVGFPVIEIDKPVFEASDEPVTIDSVVELPSPLEGPVVVEIDTPVDRTLLVATLDVTVDGGLDVPRAVEATCDEGTFVVTKFELPPSIDETSEVKAGPLAVGPRVSLLRPRAYGPKAWVEENKKMIGNKTFGHCRRNMLCTMHDERPSLPEENRKRRFTTIRGWKRSPGLGGLNLALSSM